MSEVKNKEISISVSIQSSFMSPGMKTVCNESYNTGIVIDTSYNWKKYVTQTKRFGSKFKLKFFPGMPVAKNNYSYYKGLPPYCQKRRKAANY